MIIIPITELTTEGLLKKVEEGEVCVITKEGKPYAEIFPLKHDKPRWKRRITKIELEGNVAVSDVILKMRDEEKW